MQDKTALVAGASGLVGKELLHCLFNTNDYTKVISIVRTPMGVSHPKLQEHVIDFNRIQEYAQSLEADHVFCCLGTTMKKAKTQTEFRKVDVEYPLELARAMKGKCHSFLLVSSVGANPKSKVFYSRMKGLVEERLKEMRFTSLHIFRPSLLLGERNEIRRAESIAGLIAQRLSFIFTGPLKKYAGIKAQTVACGMVLAANSGREGVYIYESNEIQNLNKQVFSK